MGNVGSRSLSHLRTIAPKVSPSPMRQRFHLSGLSSSGGTTPEEARLSLPHIDPLPDGTVRPFWSVMIPIYNSTAYLGETLRSLLAQDPGPEHMQIEVVDNCSTDDPESLVNELGAGRVAFYRQPRNLGPIENFNTCIRHARGEWVHILHGDDIVRPTYYEKLRQDISAHPEADAAVCRVIYIDEDGHWIWLPEMEAGGAGILDESFAKRLLVEQSLYFVGTVVRRSVYEELGGFRLELRHSADWDMWKRIAVRKRVLYEPEPLGCYRLHPGADSARAMRTGETVLEERRSIQLSCLEVPAERAQRLYRAAMKAAAIRAIRRAERLWKKGDRETAIVQLREALRCSWAPAVLMRLGYVLGRIAALSSRQSRRDLTSKLANNGSRKLFASRLKSTAETPDKRL